MNKHAINGLRTRTAATALAAVMLYQSGYALAGSGRDDVSILEVERQQMEHLSKADFHPNLLPVILRNSDFIGLTETQEHRLRSWRKDNFTPMLAAMNAVLMKMIEFQEAALTKSVNRDRLEMMQEEIFALQKTVLDYKLSCRENIINSFTAENWDNFYIVLSDTGYSLPVISNAVPAAGRQ